MAPRGNAAKRWTFTINNWTLADYDKVLAFTNKFEPVFLICGKERGELLTDHLQGFVHLKSKQRLTFLKANLSERAHFECAKGSDEDNRDYCSKEDSEPFIFGTPVKSCSEKGGGRITGQQVIAAAIALANTREPFTVIKNNEEFAVPVLRHYQSFEKLAASVRRLNALEQLQSEYKEVRLKVWQQAIINTIQESPHPRTIHWYWEATGGTGKTWMSKYLVACHSAFRAENGKSNDIKYAYAGEKVVVFDFTRSQTEHINYEIIESIKNGCYFNCKYESGMRIFPTPHVFCFSNSPPDLSKMSADRWHICQIRGLLLSWSVPVQLPAARIDDESSVPETSSEEGGEESFNLFEYLDATTT